MANPRHAGPPLWLVATAHTILFLAVSPIAGSGVRSAR
jgi:hypothetical protein